MSPLAGSRSSKSPRSEIDRARFHRDQSESRQQSQITTSKVETYNAKVTDSDRIRQSSIQMSVKATVNMAVQAIIRPPRYNYNHNDIPKVMKAPDGTTILRHALQIVNSRGEVMVGSIYHCLETDPLSCGRCAIYLHGNASSQLEGQFLVPNLCNFGVIVCCVDFCGCGCSTGDFVSLGFHERYDIEYLLSELSRSYNIDSFVLWGRSMGAATAVLVDHPCVKGIVVDSCYSSIVDMCIAVSNEMTQIPSWIAPASTWALSVLVKKRGGFDMYAVKPVEEARERDAPALFAHAEHDDFVPIEQGRRVFEAYRGKKKEFVVLEGTHNSPREIEWIHRAIVFVLDVLGVEHEEVEIMGAQNLREFHFESLESMLDKI